MPLYEYECPKCCYRVADLRKMGHVEPGKCLQCGEQMQRRISAVSIIFKGKGFHTTDYPKNK